MKDIERHPQVLHLPAPHIWQFTPTPVFTGVGTNNNDSHINLPNGTNRTVNGHAHTHIPLKISKTNANPSLKLNGEVLGGSQGGGRGEGESGGEHIVATLELHVQRDLPDEDVLRLTRWAWEKCVGALTMEIGSGGGVEHGGAKADVTVGVVRG